MLILKAKLNLLPGKRMWNSGISLDMCILTCVLLLLLWGVPLSRVDGTITITRNDPKVIAPPEGEVATTTPTTTVSGRICGNIDIRNSVREFRHLRGCSVVEGFVQIVLIDRANESDFENLSFPELREITCYLILYRVKGLKNLGTLFPNLTVIRGNNLFQDYALVIYEMLELQEIGLWSLTAILRGSVRIEKNYQLCYYNTVKWDEITNGSEHYIENNKEARSCPSNGVCENDGCLKTMCWGSQTQFCRKIRQKGECHELCLGGCMGPRPDQCFVCGGYLNDGECIKECPPDKYSYLGRRCVTEAECLNITTSLFVDLYEEEETRYRWPFNRTCVEQCPPEYEEVHKGNRTSCQSCKGRCRHECTGGVISSIADAQVFRGCTTINLSLEIFIRGSGSHIVKELEENLASIEEIQGYLKVSRSFPLTSLSFLKNLRVIHGNMLEEGRYSLIVIENQNLQELWNWTERPVMQITNGALKFHYNPKLCLSEIDKLQEIANLPNYTNFDVSRESNGDKGACGVVALYANATVMNSRTVLIEWEPLLGPDPSTVLGYTVYYIEAPERNITEHDGLDACGNIGWKVIDVQYDTDQGSTRNTSQTRFVPRLQPFTQYAYYVKAYTSNNIGGQSKIKYFRTFPDRPSVPKEIHAVSNSTSNIILHWLPPEHPNGIISHYLIAGKWLRDEQSYLDQRNYCKYPLQHIPDSNINIGLIPTSISVPAGSHSCCDAIDTEPLLLIEDEDDYEKFCMSGFSKQLGDESDSCREYFYTFVHNGIQELTESTDRFPDLSSSSSSQHKTLALNHSIKNSDGVYEQVVERIDANTTSLVLNHLHHFAEYTINVFACREPHSTKPRTSNSIILAQTDYESFCSPAGIVSVRTKSLSDADKINYDHLSVDISNTSRSVKLSWREPKKPNGIIVSYNIEHHRTDIQNHQLVHDCISRKEYKDNGGGFVLYHLAPGNYSFRVKATSLAGEGEFTEYYHFHIEELPVDGATGIIVGILIGGMFILMGFAVLAVLWWKKRMNDKRLVIPAVVNPDYVSAGIDDEWEVPRDNIQLLKELGQGSFGMVYEGLLTPQEARCAVKMIRDNASVHEKMEFLNEASMMKSFAGAHHVVKLLGVVSRGQPALVIMELMAKGDLKTYLRACREPPPPPPDTHQMLIMAAQIADGMAYLEAHKFVHRDLAARNCMVAEDLTVKIGDFGMTRDIYETDYYRNDKKCLLPVRWMSPESLADGVFTCQSDVWSFGVVLWEMTTLAEQPYQGLANEQVLNFILGGGTLDRPLSCPDIFYHLMRDCWHKRPNRRPRFVQIVSEIESKCDLGATFKESSFYHSKEGQDIKASIAENQDTYSASEVELDKPPLVSFFQLLSNESRLPSSPFTAGTSHMNQSSSYVLPGTSCSPDKNPNTTVPNQNDIPEDSYVLPGSLMGQSGRYNLGQLPPETECLLPSTNSDFETQHKIHAGCMLPQFQNTSEMSSRRKKPQTSPPSRKISVTSSEDGYVPAENVYIHPDSVSAVSNSCCENAESLPSITSDRNRRVSFNVPEDNYVLPDNAAHPETVPLQTHVPEVGISIDSDSNSRSQQPLPSELNERLFQGAYAPAHSSVPSTSGVIPRRYVPRGLPSEASEGMDATASAESPSRDRSRQGSHKDSRHRLPNGLVNGYISVPHEQEEDS